MAVSKIEIRNIYKIFGSNPSSVMSLVKSGANKQEVMDQTGHVVGLDNVSLDIDEGEIFVVMGLSGSGKSTLIRHLNRLIEPTSGSIIIDGQDVLKLNTKELGHFRQTKMAMVFQRFGLLPHKNIIENVGFGLQIQLVDEAIRNAAAQEKIDLVGLTGFEKQYPDQLSGGMQQRVGLARALATDPDILLMDEAFSALDPLIRTDMQKRLLELQTSLKKTIVFITHDLDEALFLGDRICILEGGRIAQIGTPEDIILKPADDYVARFVGDVNKAKVLRAKSVMAKPRKLTAAETKKSVQMPVNALLEDLMPIVLKQGNIIEIVDDAGMVVGQVGGADIASALEKDSLPA